MTEPWKDPKKWVTQVETLQAENKLMRGALDRISDIYMEERDAEMYNLFEVAQHCLAKLNVPKQEDLK